MEIQGFLYVQNSRKSSYYCPVFYIIEKEKERSSHSTITDSNSKEVFI